MTSKIAETEKEKNKLLNEISELKQASEATASRLEKESTNIEVYEKEIKELKRTISDLEIFEAEFKGITENNSNLKKKIESLEEQITALPVLTENDVIIHLSDVQMSYMNELLKNERAVKAFNEEHEHPVMPKLDDEKNSQIGNMLLAWFFNGAWFTYRPFAKLDIRKWLKTRENETA